ncbi:MAG: hypothetical protein RL375_4156 [Pseudomonadota bacterium]|jgi:hypothetical protein
MPELDPPIAYLAADWQAAGMVQHGGMGAAPLAPSEVLAWANGAGRKLDPWEFQNVIDMSRAYVSEGSAATAPERAPPFAGALVAHDTKVVADKVGGFFKARIRS